MLLGLRPGRDVVAVPQAPGPVRASAVPVDVLTIGPIWWSYHPSESSYMITTAVLFQFRCCSRKLIVLTINVCSSRGSEYPAWPSWYDGALRKLTAGKL